MKTILTSGLNTETIFLAIFGFIYIILMIFVFIELLALKRDAKLIKKTLWYWNF